MNEHVLVIGKRRVSNPSWRDVESAVLAIGTGEEPDTVLLQQPDEELPWLTVGGKRDNRYSVTVEVRPAEAFVLMDPTEAEGDVEVTFPFGEWDIVARKTLVPLDAALQAAKHYFETRLADPKLTWKKFGKGLAPS